MKKYGKYIKWIILFVLSLIPCALFAQTSVVDTLTNLTFNPTTTDISVEYLAKIFGTVPGVQQLTGVGTTILGPIFSVFNAGILAICGMFLGYTTFKIVTETTMDGSSIGKSATVWTAVRVALSTSLLVPQPSGYSFINGIIMWVAMQSIGLADFTWDSAVNYLKAQAVPTEEQAKAAEVNYSLIDYSLSGETAEQSNYVGSSDVLRCLVCSYTIQDAIKQKLITLKTPEKFNAISSKFSSYKNITNKNTFVFPYFDASAKVIFSLLNNAGIKIKPSTIGNAEITGICGSIGYDIDNKKYSNIFIPAKRAALQNMIAVLDPVAKRIVNLNKIDMNSSSPNYKKRSLDVDNYIVEKPNIKFAKTGVDTSTAVKYLTDNLTYLSYINPQDYRSKIIWPPDGTKEMLEAAATYQIGVANAKRTFASLSEVNTDKIFEDAKKSGWIIAASYYKLLLQSAEINSSGDIYSRLTAYSGDKEMTTKDADTMRGQLPATAIFTYSAGSNLEKLIGAIDPDSKITLSNSLAWIYYSTPYSKLLGESVASIAGFKAKLPTLKVKGYTDSLRGISAQLGVGAALLALPPTTGAAIAGIPLLVTVPMQYLLYDVTRILEKWNDIMGGPTASINDPIIKLQLLGEEMIKRSTDYLDQIKSFFISTSVSFSVGAVAQLLVTTMLGAGTFWGATTGLTMAAQTGVAVSAALNEIARTVIFMYLPIGLAIVGPLFVTGATLAIYVPLIPYLLFLFGAISWFISLIVLMAAAPIICFLMLWGTSSQENPLLSREAEVFVMQIVAVFFRPTLMVIGLIVGVILARIGVDVLNTGFKTIIDTIVFKTTDTATVVMVKQLGIVIIYTFIMVSLVNLCFSTIHLLYSEVMRIAGIQASAIGMEEKHLGEVKAAATQFAEAGISGAKEAATSLRGAAPSRLEKVEVGKPKKGPPATAEGTGGKQK